MMCLCIYASVLKCLHVYAGVFIAGGGASLQGDG